MSKRQNTFDSNRFINQNLEMANGGANEIASVEGLQQQNNELKSYLNEALASIEQFKASFLTNNEEDNESVYEGEIGNEPTAFNSLGTIPNYITGIPTFSGDASNLMQWISDVEGVLELFAKFKNTYQYSMMITCIRRKIIGEANSVLTQKNTVLNWKSIKTDLKSHYGDKRDTLTLTSQLNHFFREKNESVESFYNRIIELQSLLCNGIRIDPKYPEGVGKDCVIQFCQSMCLSTFIQEIGKPLDDLLEVLKPKTLLQAYNFAKNRENKEIRANMRTLSFPRTPSMPQRIQNGYQKPFNHNNNNHFNGNPNRFQNNFPNRNFNNNFQNNNFQNFNPQNRGFQNQNFPKPEPMDVDRSLQMHQPSNQYQKHGVVRRSDETPSWKKNLPINKRQAFTVQQDKNPDETLGQYLNVVQTKINKKENFHGEHSSDRLT